MQGYCSSACIHVRSAGQYNNNMVTSVCFCAVEKAGWMCGRDQGGVGGVRQ